MAYNILRFEDVPDRNECFIQVLFTDANTGKIIPYAQWLTGSNYDDYKSSPESLDSIISGWEEFAKRNFYDNFTITPRQARLALLNAGLFDTIDTYISTQSKAIQIEWEFANEIRRDWPLVLQAAEALNLSVDQVDDLFEVAARL